MRLLLKFKTSTQKLPLDYRGVILSFLKKSLSEIAGGKYYERYYSDKGRRPFTFAVNLPKPVFGKEEITISKNELSLTFSTADSTTGFVFMSAFIAQQGKKFKAPLDNEFVLQSVMQMGEKTIDSNFVLVKMLSPLCLREHSDTENKDMYYSVASDVFAEKSKHIISEQLTSEGFSDDVSRQVEIIPINGKKTVVKHYDCMIECSIGDFAITADKSVINYFLKNGIGSRKSCGFGCAVLIAEEG